DAVVSLFSDVAANVLTDGQRYGKFGSGHPDLVPYQAFPACDGYFIVACLTNAFWKRLCAAIGREDLLADPRFATNDLRVQHRAAAVPLLAPALGEHTDEVLREFGLTSAELGELRAAKVI